MSYKLQKQYRLKGHDYSSNGTYFITICAKNKENLFGEIDENKIHLSPIGKVASDFWNEIPKHYSFVMLDEFTVMPNHIHGIIIICNPDNFHPFQCRNGRETVQNEQIQNGVSTVPTKLQPQQNSLSIVIRNYKSAVTAFCRKNDLGFDIWQPRFHDRIIRDDKELTNVQKYVYNNVINWGKDKYF